MTGQNCAPGDFNLSEWVSAVQEKYSPISFLWETQTKTDFPAPPPPSLPQTDWSAPDWLCTSKKRQAFDHHCGRLTSSGIIGADLAVEYLQDKYRNNRAIATIKQASGVILSFLHFLNEGGTNILKITRQDICAYVEHEQDRGLMINSVISNLRDVYPWKAIARLSGFGGSGYLAHPAEPPRGSHQA